MLTKMKHKLPTLLCSLVLLMFAGCTPPKEYSSYLKDYEIQYKRTYSYTVHEVKREGDTIHVREFGNDRPGSPIILMHGFPDDLHLYDRLAPLLSEKHRVIAFDFLGWGNSDKPENHNYNTQSLLADLNAVISHFRFNHVVLVGHDASGFPAIDWALNNPERIDTLVLLNTVYYPMQSVKPPEAIALFSTPSLMRSIRRWGAYRSDSIWQKGLIEQTSKFYSDPEVREKYVKIFAQQALEIRPAFFGLNEVLRAEVKQRQNEITRIKKFSKPVAIIFGGDDPYLNVNVAKEFHATFPNSTLTIVDNAGHYVQLDKPNEVAMKILKSIKH